MGYLFLCISLLAGAAKGFCGKKASGIVTGLRDSVLASILRMGLCVIIGLAIVICTGSTAHLYPNTVLLLTSALSGVSTSIFVVSWLCSVRKSAYMLVDVFLMLGVLVPILLGNICFSEQISGNQWLGIGILFCAVIVLCSYNNSIKAKLTLPALLLLALSGLTNGITDFSQKLFTNLLPETPASVFNFYTYVFAFITLSICLLFFKKEAAGRQQPFNKIFGYIPVMALCLFANSLFKTMAATHLDSVLLYPLNQGAALILSTLMSAVFFRERLNSKCVLGICVAFIGLLVINVL